MFFETPAWVMIIYTIIATQLNNADVTLRLHREGAHRSILLADKIREFLRFIGWSSHGMKREWIPIHRKHHRFCETENDPHSPIINGIGEILLKGVWYYKRAAADKESLKPFSDGLHLSRYEKFYDDHPWLGIIGMLVLDVLLFGVYGLIIWTIQVLWIPVTGAGIINGIGHYFGYRNNKKLDNNSRNIVPWGILIGGEELHNNHHDDPNSAKFSQRWFEFDLGWLWIQILKPLGGVTVTREVA